MDYVFRVPNPAKSKREKDQYCRFNGAADFLLDISEHLCKCLRN